MFLGAFFTYAERSGPVADAIADAAREWFDALRESVEHAQKKKEIASEDEAKRIAIAINGILIGAYWAYLLGERGSFRRRARSSILAELGRVATDEIPSRAFDSVKAWTKYLNDSQ